MNPSKSAKSNSDPSIVSEILRLEMFSGSCKRFNKWACKTTFSKFFWSFKLISGSVLISDKWNYANFSKKVAYSTEMSSRGHYFIHISLIFTHLWRPWRDVNYLHQTIFISVVSKGTFVRSFMLSSFLISYLVIWGVKTRIIFYILSKWIIIKATLW